jgi:organic radical activating enzyme
MLNHLNLELCGGCNYTCKICPQGIYQREKPFLTNLPFSLAKDIIQQAKKLGAKSVSLQGSGEPILYKKLKEIISFCKELGLKSFITTNLSTKNVQELEELFDAGLSNIRVSFIGYDKETYHKWMGQDKFQDVYDKVCSLTNYNISVNCIAIEKSWLDEYKSLFDNKVKFVVWEQHNWSGQLNDIGEDNASCPKPTWPVLNVRAGGLKGAKAAVVPCCNVLGQDSKAVLGHLSNHSIEEVWNGETYNDFRKKHAEGRAVDIDVCRKCDQRSIRRQPLLYSNYDVKLKENHSEWLEN